MKAFCEISIGNHADRITKDLHHECIEICSLGNSGIDRKCEDENAEVIIAIEIENADMTTKTTEAVTEAATEAATEAVTEAATEPVTEAATEAATEAVTEATTEAVTEAATITTCWI